ncbi:T9SS type A sorting domain-containing protein [uncultured Algibacter sp.]|uniref:T9SS type A sorting domain-containing protein n=1 Tax=uncultured Algibacter sp. TaxID=298659 RepID=UPI00260308D3|nr:T9SS type A sorting domain-containing protein [uncultured Algibacter sp.]
MKTKYTLIIYLCLFTSCIFAQNIFHQTWVTKFVANSNSCTSEVGDEEYTWYGYAKDNINTTEASTGCKQKTVNGSTSLTQSSGLRSKTNTATQITWRIRAWEDDNGNRCTYDTGLNSDDCLTNISKSFNLSNPDESSLTTKTGNVGNSNFNMNITYTYRYAVTLLDLAVENSSESFSTLGSDRPFWGATGNWSSDGVDCAASGTIGNNQSSIIKTTVSNKSSVTFKWRVSSAASDYLQVFVNGVLDEQISGESGWITKTIEFTENTNTIEWLYIKDASGSSGLDRGFVDAISFEEATLSTNSNILDEVSIYPNPVTSILNIKGLKGDNYNMDIYDLSGKKIKAILDIESKVDLSALSDGFYMIRLYSQSNAKTYKIMKK